MKGDFWVTALSDHVLSVPGEWGGGGQSGALKGHGCWGCGGLPLTGEQRQTAGDLV